MIPKINRGGRMGGLIRYILGPGERNEHTDPRLVAGDSSPPALAAAVCGLLDDAEGLSAIAARCRDRVEPALGWDAVAARYLQAYQAQLLGRQAIAGR